MATLAQIRTAVDTRLATLWAHIQTKQDAYFLANGRYWQELRTHATNPADGATALPDVGQACPDYQPAQPWPAAILSTPMEMAIQIDQYAGPQGMGYTATVFVTVNGVTYSRTAQQGLETWRAQPWGRVPDAISG